MKAWIVEAGKMVLQEVPMPVCKENQLLVKVHAFGLNRADLSQKQGSYPAPAGVTDILGLEIAGEVVETFDGSDFTVGSRVFGLVQGGAYGEYVAIDAPMVNKLPENISMVQAASLPEAWLTVLLNLNRLGNLQAGQRILLHAGASGVGAAAIAYAKLCGAYVIGTSRSAHKLEFMKKMGADEAILADDLDSQVERIKINGGIDLILDPVGASTFETNQKLLNTDGKLVIIGIMSGAKTTINLGALLMKRQQILGSTLRSLPLEVRAEVNQIFSSLVPHFISGKLAMPVDKVFTYERLPEALAYLENSHNSGKIVVSHE